MITNRFFFYSEEGWEDEASQKTKKRGVVPRMRLGHEDEITHCSGNTGVSETCPVFMQWREGRAEGRAPAGLLLQECVKALLMCARRTGIIEGIQFSLVLGGFFCSLFLNSLRQSGSRICLCLTPLGGANKKKRKNKDHFLFFIEDTGQCKATSYSFLSSFLPPSVCQTSKRPARMVV